MNDAATTLAEAEAQTLKVPEYDGWFDFAHSLSSYNIAEEMGFDFPRLARLYAEKYALYRAHGRWEGSRLELRLVLFFEARALRFTDAPGVNPDEDESYRAIIMSPLEAIRRAEGEEHSSGRLRG